MKPYQGSNPKYPPRPPERPGVSAARKLADAESLRKKLNASDSLEAVEAATLLWDVANDGIVALESSQAETARQTEVADYWCAAWGAEQEKSRKLAEERDGAREALAVMRERYLSACDQAHKAYKEAARLARMYEGGSNRLEAERDVAGAALDVDPDQP